MSQSLEEKLEFCSLVRDVAENELGLTFTRKIAFIEFSVYTEYLGYDWTEYVGYASEPLDIKSVVESECSGFVDTLARSILSIFNITRGQYKSFYKESQAERFRNETSRKGYDVHIYKCFTHANSQIGPIFLELDPVSQACIMMHEAWHVTKRSRGLDIDYKLEETVGNVFGTSGLKNLQQHTRLIEEDDRERLKQDIKMFNDYIDKYYARLMEIYSSDRSDEDKLSIKKEIIAKAEQERVSNAERTRSSFFRNRYFEDSVSNATFIRHKNYNFMFDELDEIFNSTTPEDFIEFVKKSPKDVDELREYILDRLESL